MDIAQGNFLKTLQSAFNKAAQECIKHVSTTSVKAEIKLIIDKDDHSVIKILCSVDTKLPPQMIGDQGQIVDDTIHTQTPVSEEMIAEILDFTGESKTSLKLTK